MDAKELRIGNLVKHIDEGSILKLETINKESIWVDELPDYHYEMETELIEPIPLTEEWLLKFGFDESLVGLKKHVKNAIWVESNLECIFITYFSSELKFKHIKYVHQLQNLYFALTGEELTIK